MELEKSSVKNHPKIYIFPIFVFFVCGNFSTIFFSSNKLSEITKIFVLLDLAQIRIASDIFDFFFHLKVEDNLRDFSNEKDSRELKFFLN